MSVAASLAVLRQTVNPPSQRPASVARSELAASARNAITLLQRADKNLGKLMRPLLLLSPDADRLTLMPEAEKELRKAAVELILRLAPVFLLRSTQSVLEWLLVGLSLATHGSDEEYDQLIISALPFCEEQAFVHLMKRMAPFRRKWLFLWPVVRQSKPASLSFFMKGMPQHLFPLFIQSATLSASMRLHVSSISSFLANTLTRRVLIQSEAPVLTLACVECLRKLTSKKFFSRASESTTQLVAAMLSAVGVAMSANLVDPTLLQAASHACACVLLNCNVPDLKYSAASCLVLTCSTLPAFVPTKVAQKLLSSTGFKDVLKRLEPCYASSLFGSLVLTSIGDKPESIPWPLLKETLSVSALLTEDTITKCVVDLLHKVSHEAENDELLSHEAVGELASVIAPLARGRFAGAVDLALRQHYGQRKKKARKDRYSSVDKALAEGLHGTQFAPVSTTEDVASLSLSAALDHPEPSVRRTALQSLSASKDFSSYAEVVTLEVIMTKLTSMIRSEEDLEIVNIACDCVLNVCRAQDIQHALLVSSTRYVDEYEQVSRKALSKKRIEKKSALLKAMFSRVLKFCRRLVTQESESIHALICGMAIAGYLPSPLEKSDEETVLQVVSEHWEKMKMQISGQESEQSKVERQITTAVQGYLFKEDIELTKFCDALMTWNPRWVLHASKIWLQYLKKKGTSKSYRKKLRSIFHCLSRACEEHAYLLHPVVLVLTNNGRLFCKLPSSAKAKLAFVAEVWSIVARDGNDHTCKSFLRTIVSAFSLATCVKFLRGVCLSGAARDVKAISLRWYINLCVLHPCEDVRKETMTALIRILYGEDYQMQKTVMEICEYTTNEEGMRKRELQTELWSFLTTVSKLSSDIKQNPKGGELERLIYSDIQRKVITPIKTPQPLLCSKQGQLKTPLNFDALMFNASREKDNRQVLNAFLRALHGYRIQTAEQCSSVISLLLSHLPNLLSSEEERNVILENVSRLTQTLCETPVEILSETSRLTNLSSLTISQMKTLSPKAVSSYDSCEEPLTTLLGLSALLINVFRKSEPSREHRIPLLGYLFSFSTMSSGLGISTRRKVDTLCCGSVLKEELVLILKTGCETLSPSAKRQKVLVKNSLQDYSDVAREACRGILEALLRWASTSELNRFPCLSGSLDGLKCCLSDLLKSFTALRKDGSFSMEDIEYDMSLLLQVQSVLYKNQPSRQSRAISVNEIAEIAQYVGDGSEETPEASAVRQNAVRLLEILAPIYGADMHEVLAPVIEDLVSKGNSKQILLSLDAFVPALIESGCDFERICSWVIEAGYSNGSLSDTNKSAVILSSCCKLLSDSKRGLITSIRSLERRLKYVDDDLVARECANILLGVKMSAVHDICTLQEVPARIRCKTAFTVLQSPSFITKLFSTANELSVREGNSLNDAFSSLFLGLLVCDDTNGRRNSVAALITILPLPLFQKCVNQGLKSKDSKVRIRTMNTLRERFDADDAPMSYSWKKDELSVLDTKEMRSIELSFLTEVGTALCSICKGTYSFATYEERILAGSTMEKLVTGIGSSHQQAVLSFAGGMLDLIRVENIPYLSELEGKKAKYELAANCLDLFTSFVRCLGKNAVPFVPIVLTTAAGVLEQIFNPKSTSPGSTSRSSTFFSTLISISEAAVKFITTVLDNCPTFLGIRSLQSLITLNLCCEADVLNDLLGLAMSKAPPGTVAVALSKATEKLNESNAGRDGISRVMRALSGGLDKMHKSEVSLHMYQFEQSITSCLEYGRHDLNDLHMAGSSNSYNATNSRQSTDSLLSEFRDVDQSCSEALTSLVMKLPELKFKKLFNGFVQWCDGGSLSSEAQIACEAMELGVNSNVTRATAFYQLVLYLCEELHSIMVPYVFQILEDILCQVSKKKSVIQDPKFDMDEKGSPTRKRKRSRAEKERQSFICSMLVGFEERVTDCCLQIVLMLLKQKLGPELFTATVASKILDSLLTAFDNSDGESESVSLAMCSLATKIAASGKASESREQSRELLISFARSLLLRTREKSARIRAGALKLSCAVAQAVGDEYLVTLPESMPVLAEVIDDEQGLVRKETRRYVRILEGLAGESILDQLK